MSKFVTLSDISEIVRGVTFSKEDTIENPQEGYVAILRSGNIQDQLILDNDLVWLPKGKVSQTQLLKKNDLVMCMSSGSGDLVGKLAPVLIDNWNGSFGAFCAVIRPNDQKCFPAYLKHFLQSKKFRQWTKQSQGANIKNIRKSELENYELLLPTIDEQKRIANILDKAASIRRKRQQAIHLVDDFLRATFLDMFGDPETNTKRWKVKPLSELCEVKTGGTPSREKGEYYGGNIPWVKTGEVDSEWIMSSEESITDKAIAETNCKLFPVKTVLVAMYGQGKTRGKAGMLGISAATNQACAAILPSDNISPEFLLTFLQNSYETLRAMGRGGNQENLNLGMIKSFNIIVPPKELVLEFLQIRNKIKLVSSRTSAFTQEIDLLNLSLTASRLG